MTTANTIRADLQATLADCATDIVASFHRENIPTNVAIAIAANVVGMLIDELPTEERSPFLRAFAADLLRMVRLDA